MPHFLQYRGQRGRIPRMVCVCNFYLESKQRSFSSRACFLLSGRMVDSLYRDITIGRPIKNLRRGRQIVSLYRWPRTSETNWLQTLDIY